MNKIQKISTKADSKANSSSQSSTKPSSSSQSVKSSSSSQSSVKSSGSKKIQPVKKSKPFVNAPSFTDLMKMAEKAKSDPSSLARDAAAAKAKLADSVNTNASSNLNSHSADHKSSKHKSTNGISDKHKPSNRELDKQKSANDKHSNKIASGQKSASKPVLDRRKDSKVKESSAAVNSKQPASKRSAINSDNNAGPPTKKPMLSGSLYIILY